jgi:peroxiredoxin Q/BCP
LVQLQKDLSDIEATGTQVVGISYDSVEALKKFSESQGIHFPLLSDEGSATIKAFGIHDREGYAHPGTYLIDQQGTVRAALFLDGYRDRHTNSALIEAAKQAG